MYDDENETRTRNIPSLKNIAYRSLSSRDLEYLHKNKHLELIPPTPKSHKSATIGRKISAYKYLKKIGKKAVNSGGKKRKNKTKKNKK